MDKASYDKALINENDSTIVEKQLTKDGIENFGYFNDNNLSGTGQTDEEKEKDKKKRKGAYVMWSPNSKYFVVKKVDNTKVKDLWVINNVSGPRPTLETYKYWMPGEKEAPVDHLYVFDISTATGKELNVSKFKDQGVAVWSDPGKVNTRDDDFRASVWLGDNSKFYFTRTSRDQKRIDVCTVDVTTATVNPLITETFNTYIENKRVGLVNGGKELIKWSEQDGWAHFYLHDESGKLKNQITSGTYHCEEILGIDEAKRVLYFSANGKEAGEDPYLLHAYRVNFDGTGLKLLNPGNFDHAMRMNDNNTFFVNNFSRVNSVPASVLYNAEGKKSNGP
jgi:dipeptidyl-peptidase 4